VRLMSDYGAGSPIWVSDGVVSPSMLGVSEDLAARLYAWQDYFEQHFHFESGWLSPRDADGYMREGEELRRLLSAEIGSSYRVDLDLWPVTEG
jgi:hypothetical protein